MNMLIAVVAAPALGLIIAAALRDRYHSPVQIGLLAVVRVLVSILLLGSFWLWPGKQPVGTGADTSTVFILADQAALSRPALVKSLKREVDSFTKKGVATEAIIYNWTKKGQDLVRPPVKISRRMATLPMALTYVQWAADSGPVPGILYVSPTPPNRSDTDQVAGVPARWIGEPPRGNVIRSVRIPRTAFTKSRVPVRITTGRAADPVTLELSMDSTIMAKWALDVGSSKTVRTDILPGKAGTHEVRLTLTDEDRAPVEEYSLSIRLLEKPTIVQVTVDGRDNALTAHLGTIGFAIHTVPLRDLVSDPAGVIPPGPSGMVIIDSVDPSGLPKGTVTALERAVQKGGTRLLYITGADLQRSSQGAPLEKLLPVKFGREASGAEGDKVVLVCIVDASWSMYFTAAGMTGAHNFTPERFMYNKISMARKALLNITGTLRHEDILGVLTVRDHPAWVVSPEPDRSMEEARELISRIQADGPGINLYSGLIEAYRKLKDVGGDIKHVLVFLDTGDVDEYQVTGTGTVWELVRRFNDAGITISFIGFGKAGDKDIANINQLAELSGGYFYLTTDIKEIPGFSMRDIEQMTSTLVDYQARTVKHFSTDMPTVDSLPGIRGQAMTTLKPGARLLAWSEKGYPLAAAWPYGAGVVSVFTADSGQAMASSWITGRQRPWEKLLALVINPVTAAGDVFVQEEDGGKALYTRTPGGDEVPTGRWSAGANRGGLAFTELSRGLYRARLPAPRKGGMIVTVNRQPGARAASPVTVQVPADGSAPMPLTITNWSIEPEAGREIRSAPWNVEKDVLVLLLLLTALLLAVDELSRPE